MKNYKNFLLIVLAFLAGSAISLGTTLALAQSGDTNLIHGCVKNTLLPNAANLRIVGENVNCNANETALDWPKTASSGGNSDFVCVECIRRDILIRINQQNLINVNLDRAILSGSFLPNENFSGSSFVNAVLSGGIGVGESNFTDADLTNANLRGVNAHSTNYTRAKLTNADLSTGADLSNANFTDANLTDVNFTDSGLIGATNMDTATRTGIIWSNTTCPDGTNSDNNGDTCEGHLTP